MRLKWPTWFFGRLPFNYFWESVFFFKIRKFKDGISFFELKFNLDLYNPLEYKKFKYCPHLNIHFVILNYTVFEINLYKRINE